MAQAPAPAATSATSATSATPRARSEPGLLRFAIVGSVDDGKSTLVGRLLHDAGAIADDHLEALAKIAGRGATGGGRIDLSLVTDGLRAEREQGVTIDVAWRYFSTPKRRFIVIDAPGHEQYTRNMGSGASHADLAVLLVDASLGILTQTRRHAFICSLFGIPRLVVAVNKMDTVGWSQARFDALREEFAQFTARLGFRGLDFVPTSALLGDNIVARSTNMPWYDGPPLLSLLENVYTGGDRNLVDFRFAVQWVARGAGGSGGAGVERALCGQIASGVVKPGDDVVVLPSHRRTRVRSVRLDQGGLRRELPYAFAPMSVAIVLEDDVDAGRGAMLAHPANVPHAARSLEAMVVWLHEQPLRPGADYLIKHGASWVRASCAGVAYRINHDSLHREQVLELGANDLGRARFTLFEERFVDPYARNRGTGRFIVVDPASNLTLGAGMIVDRETERERAQPGGAAQSGSLTPVAGKVSAAERAGVLRQKPATFWLTGLSGAGKSTLAVELERRLIAQGRACMLVDGDNLRTGLNRDLGFNPADRQENIRRAAELARLMNDAGLVVIAAFISPYRADREAARAIIGEERFVEVYVSASLAVCEQRDPKGLYRRARRGEMAEFTGVSAPYEAPEHPALAIDTGERGIEDCVAALLAAALARITPN